MVWLVVVGGWFGELWLVVGLVGCGWWLVWFGVRRSDRVGAESIGGWRPNPTCYRYGYVWTVHSLYYWWRDYGQVERNSTEASVGQCYLNMQTPSDVALGGKLRAQARRALGLAAGCPPRDTRGRSPCRSRSRRFAS